MNSNKTILFVSEDITLAQLVRLKVLADSLKNLPINISFASSTFPSMIFEGCTFNLIHLNNVGALAAKISVRNCDRLYDEGILEKYIKDDIELIQKVKPDLIISDFRLSLVVSAEIQKTPLAVLINAYWSPFNKRKSFPMPDHPWESFLGLQLMNVFYPIARPFAFKYFVKPFNVLRKKYGLQAIMGLPELLTYGNYVLYPDIPEMFTMENLPSNHFFLGSIQWSPQIKLDQEITNQMKEPYIYATLGSSGRNDIFGTMVNGLSQVGFKVFLSTAGNYLTHISDNIIQREFLPGDQMAKGATMVISNGGSTTGYQSLFEGKPVLGIASNLDQYLCMENLASLGVGAYIRAGSLKSEELKKEVLNIIENQSFQNSAEKYKDCLRSYDCTIQFKNFLSSIGFL